MDAQRKYERSAPRPLSIYLGAAMSLLQPDATAEQIENHKRSIERMLYGIRKYQSHSYRRPVPDRSVIWREGDSHISFSPAIAAAQKKGAMLLIPSMINGPEILDLLPGRSFTEWLTEQGFDVYSFDWGNPARDDGLQTIDHGVLPRLIAGAMAATQHQGKKVHAVGYCMGGTLLLAAAAQQAGLFEKLVLLSAPWDFHAGDPRMMSQVMTGTPSALQLLANKPSLPVDWIQNVFAQVNPALALHKFAAFLDMVGGSEEEHVFIAVEDWLNGGQDLAGGVARSCLVDWYTHNRPAKGEWVDLSSLRDCPILLVAAGKDILVPPESALAVMQHISGAAVMEPSCGHISLMAGRNARAQVWEPVRDWLLSTP